MSTTHELRDIVLPSFDPSTEEGAVICWHVSVGETVAAGQVIAEIETAKATVDLEAPADGVIESIDIPEGSEPVSVGTVLARLTTDDRKVDTPTSPSAVAASRGDPSPGEARAPDASSLRQQPVVEERAALGLESTDETPILDRSPNSRLLASPRARRLARAKGLDLEGIVGSGPHGRVVARDLEGVTAGDVAGRAAADQTHPCETTAPSTSPRLNALGFEAGSYHLEALTGMRKTIAHRMTESFREAPHFSLSVDVELDEVMRYKHVIKTSPRGGDTKLGINDFMVWAAANALKDVPEANSSYTDDGIARHRHANVAIAVAVDGGLVAPVVRDAETRSVREIASEIRRLVEKARARKLDQADITGGTFTVSNLGMYGIRSFSSVLTSPQACVLSVGAAEKRPSFSESGYSIATSATVTLTCDHRVVDGVIGARFLSAFRERLEKISPTVAL